MIAFTAFSLVSCIDFAMINAGPSAGASTGSTTIVYRDVTDVDFSQPVGGTVTPVNKFTVLMPYLAFFGLLSTVSMMYMIHRKRT